MSKLPDVHSMLILIPNMPSEVSRGKIQCGVTCMSNRICLHVQKIQSHGKNIVLMLHGNGKSQVLKKIVMLKKNGVVLMKAKKIVSLMILVLVKRWICFLVKMNLVTILTSGEHSDCRLFCRATDAGIRTHQRFCRLLLSMSLMLMLVFSHRERCHRMKMVAAAIAARHDRC